MTKQEKINLLTEENKLLRDTVSYLKELLLYQNGVKNFKSVLIPIDFPEKYEVNCTLPESQMNG